MMGSQCCVDDRAHDLRICLHNELFPIMSIFYQKGLFVHNWITEEREMFVLRRGIYVFARTIKWILSPQRECTLLIVFVHLEVY